MEYLPLRPVQRVGRVLGWKRLKIQSPMPLENVVTVAGRNLVGIRRHRLQCESGFNGALVHLTVLGCGGHVWLLWHANRVSSGMGRSSRQLDGCSSTSLCKTCRSPFLYSHLLHCHMVPNLYRLGHQTHIRYRSGFTPGSPDSVGWSKAGEWYAPAMSPGLAGRVSGHCRHRPVRFP